VLAHLFALAKHQLQPYANSQKGLLCRNAFYNGLVPTGRTQIAHRIAKSRIPRQYQVRHPAQTLGLFDYLGCKTEEFKGLLHAA